MTDKNPDVGPRCPACRAGLATHETRDPHCIDYRKGSSMSRKWTLIIPAHEPFLNLNQRMHWAKKAGLTRAWRFHARTYAAVANLPRGIQRVHIVAHVTKPTNRQYDVHNLMPTLKACVDGLVDYGLIPDDTNSHLTGPDLRQGGKGVAGVTITITELQEDQ